MGLFMENLIFKIENIIWSPALLLLLLITHIYFTIKLKFPQKYVGKGLKYMFFSDKKNDKQGISSFKSLMTILAGTLGTGNIVGIATAISIGGIGSIFWIFVSGILAIATKYAETYIVLKYRKKRYGKYLGGAMYVLDQRIDNRFLAVLFSFFVIIASFGMGCMVQSNAMSTSIIDTFNISKYIVAAIVTAICVFVIFGDERTVSDVSSILVPLATIIYIYICAFSLIVYRNNILNGISNIIKEAFDFKAVAGGVSGSLAIKALNQGLSKGIFSNEAGLGSSPMFDCNVKEQNIQKQSIISSTSVFIDTVVLCTLTGIVIASSQKYSVSMSSMDIIFNVFKVIPYGKFLVIFCLSAFAIATIPCWAYYGKVAINYLFNFRKTYELLYKFFYVICIFVGATSSLESIWSLSNSANALMAIPNIYMIIYLRNEIK